MGSRFQHAMETMAHVAGSWPHFVLWLALLCGWVLLGPIMHWSNTWQLLANTPTTWYELFLGLALLVDGALQINLLVSQNEKMESLMEAILNEEKVIETKVDARP